MKCKHETCSNDVVSTGNRVKEFCSDKCRMKHRRSKPNTDAPNRTLKPNKTADSVLGRQAGPPITGKAQDIPLVAGVVEATILPAHDQRVKLAAAHVLKHRKPAKPQDCQHQSTRHTLNYGEYKTDLADDELNRVSLPGDTDYVKFSTSVT